MDAVKECSKTNGLDIDNNVEINSNSDVDEVQVEQNVNNCNFSVGSKTIDYFIDEQLWDKIGKELKDYDINDMSMLKWKSLEDCIDFYYTYAKVKGFGVRKDTTLKSRKDGQVISKKLVCRAEGYRRAEWNDLRDRKRDPKPFTRYGCQAFILFKMHEEYKFWKVEKFHKEHNHSFVDPEQVSYIRSFRKITEGNDLKIKTMHKARIAPNRMMRQFVNEAGSHDGVEFTKKDLLNHVQKIKREEIKDGDAETVLAYLFGMKTSNPSFFVRYTRDEEGNLEKLFWCDGLSRMEYKTFGHVLAFDTTYKCNAYNKPFVVLVGINHHRNIVPFGCALMVNENETTFVWVLEQLIEAGDGFRPLAVITDGDKAMANAIAKVLPEARHRLCLWHIMRNVKVHLKGKFLDGFVKCVKCRTPTDFEIAWKELMHIYDVQERRWAKDLYEVKKKWSEAYMQGHFYAGMRSTQRCESMHRTIKRMLNKKVFLYDFVQFYHQELNELRYEESRQDYKTTHEQPLCSGILSQLKSRASKIYTRNAFYTMCSEMSYEGYFLVKQVQTKDESNSQVFYWLQHVEDENSWYLVVNDTTHDTMYCCCMKLEFIGFPCRHMFAVLKSLNAKELPHGCVMKRWTIHAKKDLDLPKENERVERNGATTVQARHSSLMSFCINICRQASNDTFQVYKNVKDEFVKICLSLQGRKNVHKKRSLNEEEYTGIGDPLVIETGRGLRKKTKTRASCYVPTNIPHAKDEQIKKKEGTSTPSIIDLNISLQSSPTKASVKMDDGIKFSMMIMNFMPNTYREGDLSQESSIHELKKMEDDPSVFDWKPHKEW